MKKNFMVALFSMSTLALSACASGDATNQSTSTTTTSTEQASSSTSESYLKVTVTDYPASMEKRLTRLCNEDFLLVKVTEQETFDAIMIWVADDVSSFSYTNQDILINRFNNELLEEYSSVTDKLETPLIYYYAEDGTLIGQNDGVDSRIVIN